MGSKCKRFLSVLLVAILLLSIVPSFARATENTETEVTESEVTETGDTSSESTESEQGETEGIESETDESADPVCHQPGDANSDTDVHVNDAFYVLYNMLLPKEYPMNHSADYNGDGTVDANDALLVLKMAHGLVETPAYTHEYFDPTWTWNITEEGTYVSVTFRCGCKQTHTYVSSEGSVSVVLDGEKAATCTESGYAIYTASVEFNGEVYTDTKTVTYVALGHDIGEASCTESASCSRCEYQVDALGHDWVENGVTPADCDSYAVYHYKCNRTGCEEIYSDIQEASGYSHNFAYSHDVASEENACAYYKVYTCSCGEVKQDTQPFYRHTYTATVKTEATCTTDGVKTLTCSYCGDTAEETIDQNPNAHTWDESVEEEGIITYTCSACDETKTAVNATAGAAVSTDSLTDVSELKLDENGTSITLDDTTKALLVENVSVSVTVAGESATANLSDTQKAQIGSNTVYDFTMTSNGNTISDFGDGTVTISLPYTLQEGDDVDCIDVWFISDDDVEVVMGTYSNGFVTFTTNHFSYYTVTRLTPEERCATYGHSLKSYVKAATCTAEGYEMDVCQRCTEELNIETSAMLDHEYETIRTEPTCTSNGAETKTCTTCGDKIVTTLFMLGHDTAVTESQAASCTEAGYETIACSREGCGYTRTTKTNATGHNYEYYETVAPTCTTAGYDIYVCSNCQNPEHRNEQAALDHAWSVNVWEWKEGYTAAYVTLVCGHDSNHTITQKAVVTETIQGATCTTSGFVTYTAKAAYNDLVCEDVQSTTQSALGHSNANMEWEHTAAMHYLTCDACGTRYDQADHNWVRETTTEATCSASGVDTLTCTVCGYSKTEVTAATGAHSGMDDGICDVCAFAEETCYHIPVRQEAIDVSAYNVCEGAELYVMVCECGAYKEYNIASLGCTWPEDATISTEETSDGKTITYATNTCSICGLVSTSWYCNYYDEETCTYHDEWSNKYSKGETVLAEWAGYFEMESHRPINVVEERTITVDGFCGVNVLVMQCGCGKQLSDESEYLCTWEYIDGVDVCTVCGARKWWDRDEPTYENCYMTWMHRDYLEYNGEMLFTLEYDVGWTSHNYVLDSYEMNGGTCDDGGYYTYKCTGCDKGWTYYSTYHYTEVVETVDLSSWGNPCMDTVETRTCPCGKHKDYYTYGEGGHDWSVISEDAETNTTVSACANCGYTLTSVVAYGEKDENCNILNHCTDTISNGGTRTITLERTDYYSEHSHCETRELLGESCEDGVKYRNYCSDCGWEFGSYTYEHHDTYAVETLSLADIGACGGEYEVYTCACGEYAGITSWDEQCEWEYVEGGESYYIWKCSICGITMRWSENVLSEEGCYTTRLITQTFSKDGKTLKTLSGIDTVQNHRYEWELTLHEGAATCDDGYDAIGVCVDCGDTKEDTDWYGCGWWVTDIIDVPEGTFCGDAYVEVYGCACGYVGGEGLWWDNECCDFWYTWDEETESERYLCSVCGVERIITSAEEKVEDKACHYRVTQTYAYYKDGECVFSYDNAWLDSRHVYVYEQTLIDGATSCDDGYFVVRAYCAECGETLWENDENNFWHGCDTRRTARTVAATSANICGDIYRDDYSCACGAMTDMGYVTTCDMQWYAWDSENGADEYRCADCDLRYVHKASTTKVGCVNETQHQFTYYVGDVELTSVEYVTKIAAHVQIYELTLCGETCDDGFRRRAYCAVCGKTLWEDSEEDIWYGCDEHRTGYEKIGETSCGTITQETYSCACGADSWTETYYSCDFVHTGYDSENNCDIYTCEYGCGAERRRYETLELLNAETCEYMVTRQYVYYYNGEELGTVTNTYTDICHDYERMFTLLGTTCDDGYYVRSECTQCGEIGWQYEEAQFGCCGYYMGEKARYFEDADICGPVVVNMYACACGRYQNEYTNTTFCEFEWVYDDTTDTETYQCVNCGLSEYSYADETYDRENCMQYAERTYVYSIGDEEIGRITTNYQDTSHTIICEYELQGETCDDGYLYKDKCVYCGMTTYEETEVQYGCSTQRIDFKLIANHPDTCGEIYMYRSECACGQYSYYGFVSDCNFEWVSYDNDTGETVYQCMNCGLIERWRSETEYDEQNCTRTERQYRTYLLNGEEIASHVYEREEEYHTTQATFDLRGNSCEDGFYVTHDCLYCDYARTEEEPRYSHDEFITETYDLSELNSCGLTIRETSCACGLYKGYRFENQCSFDWTEKQDEDGYTIYECSTCGLGYSEFDTNHQSDINNCYASYTRCFRFYRNGELLKTLEIPYQYKYHRMIMTNDVVLNDPDAGCLGGYMVTLQCPYCHETEVHGAEGWEADHNPFYADVLYVSELGGCATRLYFYSCACGEETSFGYYTECDFQYTYDDAVDANGVTHSYSTRTCQNCALVITEDSYRLPTEDPCCETWYRTTTIQYDGETKKVFEEYGQSETHDYRVVSATLAEGIESCEDGVDVVYACSRSGCEASYDTRYYGSHVTCPIETYSLKAYGGVCEGSLAHYVCACGEVDRYDLMDVECDLDWDEMTEEELKAYIPDAIIETYQETTENNWTDSVAYIIKCAVTDPEQCNLTIRMAEYWVANEATCTATEYQIWELGYDETTGVCQKVIESIPTGESHSYHTNYNYSYISEADDNGNQISGHRYDCSVCESYYVSQTTYYEDGTYRSTQDCVNNLDNGELKECHGYWYYDRVVDGYTYETEHYYGYVYADGSEYWYRYDYSYPNEKVPCYRTATYSNIYGNTNTYEGWSHQMNYVAGEWIKERTCSQAGYRNASHVCAACQATEEFVETYSPYGHNWNQNEDGLYVCDRCGIENTNGADGVITVEDLSTEDNYIIGYYNRESVEFSLYVSVVLYNAAEGQDDEPILSGIDITYLTEENDGMQAISVSKAQVDAAVQAWITENQYAGGYAVRIAFVPVTDESTLDYAITFDTAYTEGWEESTETETGESDTSEPVEA